MYRGSFPIIRGNVLNEYGFQVVVYVEVLKIIDSQSQLYSKELTQMTLEKKTAN